MKKFNFHLRPVLQLEKIKEDKIALELAQVNEELRKVELYLTKQEKQRQKLYNDIDEVGTVKAQALILMEEQLHRQKIILDNVLKDKSDLQIKKEDILLRLTQATAKRKGLEQMKEKSLKAFKKERNKLLEAQLEETRILRGTGDRQ